MPRYMVTLGHVTSFTLDASHVIEADSKDDAVKMAKELYPENERWEWREKRVSKER
jgi:hypothetical protein